MQYREIEDIAEIRRLNNVLHERLAVSLSYAETRIIGYPAGHEKRRAFFSKSRGTDTLWWAGWNSKAGNLINLFGHGTPGEARSTLTIDVQFNLPSRKFNRRLGGAFLRELSSGKVVLAHRGIVTLGHGRFRRDRLFDAMGPVVFEAETSAGPKEFLLIAELESKSLLGELSSFAAHLRAVLQELIVTDWDSDERTGSEQSVKGSERDFGKLRNYLAEFAGKRRSHKPKRVEPDCHHGLVVGALQKLLSSRGHTLNSVEIDLVAVCSKKTLLFEVKTSASTQSVYTAIGQLCVHQPMISQLYPKSAVRKVLVLPEKPMKRLCAILDENLDIVLVTYQRQPKGKIAFSGLNHL
jgi:hypothetical protein